MSVYTWVAANLVMKGVGLGRDLIREFTWNIILSLKCTYLVYLEQYLYCSIKNIYFLIRKLNLNRFRYMFDRIALLEQYSKLIRYLLF